MNNYTKNWLLLILIIILLGVGIYYLFFKPQDSFEADKNIFSDDNQVNEDANLGELKDINVEELYENNELGFSAIVKGDMDVKQDKENIIDFIYKGSNQKDNTELSDGVRIIVSRLSYDQSTPLLEFAEELAQSEGGELIEELSLENKYNYATYTFSSEGQGIYQHLIALIYPGEVFDISVFVSDEKYQIIANKFLESFIITDSQKSSSQKEDLIIVNSPKLGESVSSPLNISGMARGSWFFEASFPVVLTDWDGLIIGTAIVQTSENWMTEEMIPFNAILEFDDEVERYSSLGNLILKKDNPSGLPEYDDALEFPVYLPN